MMRIRVNFDKTEEMRFTGHLDLYRTWERTLRRAGLPLAYSQGFKPHPRLQIAAALPLGFTSSNDLMDIWLEDELPLSSIQSKILAAIPPGLQLNSLVQVPLNQPALQSLLTASEYQITFLEPISDLDQRVQALLQKPCIVIERRGKSFDLRPLILSIAGVSPNPDGRQQLITLLRTDATLHARPDEMVTAMGISPEKALFHRLRLYFNQDIS
jgi:radical SAM-linked protein